MKFLPTVALMVLAVANTANADICYSPSGGCSTGIAQVVDGKTYCTNDECTIEYDGDVPSKICGVSIGGVATCSESSVSSSFVTPLNYGREPTTFARMLLACLNIEWFEFYSYNKYVFFSAK